MKNKSGFISQKHIQPDYYRNIFNNWAAVYIINDTEYHVQSVSDPYDISNEQIAGFEILRQCKNGRMQLKEITHTSLNGALKVIKSLKEKERVNNMKKCIMAELTTNIYQVVITDEEGNKTFLNGGYDDFKEADQTAKLEAESLNAQYVCNS